MTYVDAYSDIYSDLYGAEALPAVIVEIAFDNNPGDTSLSWTDVSDHADDLIWRRGRQNELDRIEAGTATILLDNADRRFDPAYADGPHYGQLLPMKRIRVTASWRGSTFPIFYGFVEGWLQEYTGENGALTIVPLRCVDVFKALSLLTLTGSYPEETTGERINRVLDALGWPEDDRDIDDGQSTVQASTLEGVSALAHLQLVNDSENGLLFISRDGKVTFIDRHALILAELDESLTWGDEDPEYPYTGITLDPGDSNLWNDATVTAEGFDSQNAQDAASIELFLRRSLTKETLLASESVMADLAYFLLSRFSQPEQRVIGMTSDGLPDGTLNMWETFTAVLNREIGDKLIVHRRPTGGGDEIEQYSVVEAIGGSVVGPSWQFTFNLSPAETISSYWVLGDAVQGLLGETTRLAF